MSRPTVVMATGGSGGHIYPAVAVAEALHAGGYTPLFIGSATGMEATLVPEAGFEFAGVPAGKWHRGRLEMRELLHAWRGLLAARRILRQRRPLAVAGFGGFASFPALAAAAWQRLPIVLHEQNVYPGLVTRWFAPRAAAVGLASADARIHLRRAKRIVEVGLPIREFRIPRFDARSALGLPQDSVVTLVMGGSQGSHALNSHVPEAYRRLPSELKENLYVLHACGRRWEGTLAPPGPSYRLQGFIDAPTAWSAADLAITRSGMGTIFEAAFHGVPLIMVPLPSAADDHQYHNAVATERAGGGRVVTEANLDSLATVWGELLGAGTRRRAGSAIASQASTGAATEFAQLLIEVATRACKRDVAPAAQRELS